jgi:hypothetical protein
MLTDRLFYVRGAVKRAVEHRLRLRDFMKALRLAVLLIPFTVPAMLAQSAAARLPVVSRASHPSSPLRDLSDAEIARAMRDTGSGIVAYRSDGTARGDSARRIAAYGMSMIEGGELDVGLRLYRAAFYLGVPDLYFYRDAIELSKTYRRPEDRLTIFQEVIRRWPEDAWGWRGYAVELELRGRALDAQIAHARATRLHDVAP